jgi:hypothetical protein
VAWHRRAGRLRERLARQREKNSNFRPYDVRTSVEPHSERIYLRATPTEIAALDLLCERWGGNRSQVIRSLVFDAALAERDALDAPQPSYADALAGVSSFDDVLPELPNIDDVLAAP